MPRRRTPPPYHLVPIAAAIVVILALPAFGRTALLASLAIPLVAVAAGKVLGTGQRRLVDAGLGPWGIAAGATAVTVFGTLAGSMAWGETASFLVAGLLGMATTGQIIASRDKRLTIDLLWESGIVVTGVALLVWGLGVAPNLTVTPTEVYAFVAAAIGLTGAAALVWLLIIDPEIRGTPARLVGLLLVVLASVPTVGLLAPAAVDGFGGRALAVLAVGLTASLMVHHDREVLCTPALANTLGGGERRALVALATLLVGPVLIGADLVLGLDVSLTFVAISTTTLSGSVALHVFRQLRRWGALQHDIHHDGLTGLPNREYFGDRLERAIELARVEQHIIALLFLDLDRFKNVNDSLGHSAGNELLIEVARRLRSSIEGTATVARLAGDEFAVLVPHVRTFRHTEAIGKAILGAFAEPFKVGGREIFVTPSIGAAHYPTDGVTPSELLEHADHAMYRAKERGRNNVQLYANDAPVEAGQAAKHSRLDLESALHRALEERQLSLLYQPQIDVLHNAMTGVEALLRWDHPILGPVPPGDFIPVAEESGLIDQLGEWVLLEACTQARRWQATSGFDISVAVNLSPRQFQTQRVQDLVARVLRATDLDPRLLELELTESLAVQDSEQLKEVMAELRAMGVRCAVDDFGMGYSGLDYLGRFRFDVVKIDRSFVTRIDDTGAPIVTAVIAMAKGLGMTVVAEGVETPEQAEFLRRHGCDVMQGYFFSRPLSAMQIDQVLGRLRAARPLPTSDRVVAMPLPEEARKPQLFGRAAG